MAQKVLSEAQMREYVEQEVRKTLMNENIDEGVFGTLIGLVGGLYPIIRRLGLKNISLESIVCATLANVAIAPLIGRILEAIGIPANGAVGQMLLKAASSYGGGSLGNWLHQNWDVLGLDNILGGQGAAAGASGTPEPEGDVD
jgi:hypothetical protein